MLYVDNRGSPSLRDRGAYRVAPKFIPSKYLKADGCPKANAGA
jgi:hypothetical protein